jgi:large subunit ribosomal protein L24
VLRLVGDDRVVVEGANRARKHEKPNPMKGTTGGIVEKEMPIHVSNVSVFNPATQKGERVSIKTLDDGRRVRIFRTNGEMLDA